MRVLLGLAECVCLSDQTGAREELGLGLRGGSSRVAALDRTVARSLNVRSLLTRRVKNKAIITSGHVVRFAIAKQQKGFVREKIERLTEDMSKAAE